MIPRPPKSTPFPYTPLSRPPCVGVVQPGGERGGEEALGEGLPVRLAPLRPHVPAAAGRQQPDGPLDQRPAGRPRVALQRREDWESTRLNSTHPQNSSAVFRF